MRAHIIVFIHLLIILANGLAIGPANAFAASRTNESESLDGRLRDAIKARDLSQVSLRLEQGADPNAIDPFWGFSATGLAASKCFIGALPSLKEYGADFSANDILGDAMIAYDHARYGKVNTRPDLDRLAECRESIKYLVLNDADLADTFHRHNSGFWFPLQALMDMGPDEDELAASMILKGSPIVFAWENRPIYQFFNALNYRRVDWSKAQATLAILLTKDPNADLSLALHTLASHSSLLGAWAAVFAGTLVEHGADPNFIKERDNGLTTLMKATMSLNPELMSFFLVNGLDANRFSDDGKSPLHLAVMAGSKQNQQQVVAALEMLSTFGMQVNPTGERDSGLYWAIYRRVPTIVEWLLQNGADVEKGTADGNSPLQVFAASGRPDLGLATADDLRVGRALLAYGADVNRKRPFDQRATLQLAANGFPQFAFDILDHGSILDLQDNDGNTALMLATKALQYLSWADNDDYASSVAWQNYLLIRGLVDAGARRDLRNTAGMTPYRHMIEVEGNYSDDILRGFRAKAFAAGLPSEFLRP